jgi:hypothetical protein
VTQVVVAAVAKTEAKTEPLASDLELAMGLEPMTG